MLGGDGSRTVPARRQRGSQGRVILPTTPPPGLPRHGGSGNASRMVPAIDDAFDALDRAGIAYRIRKNSWPPEPLAAGAEVDILVRRSALPAIQRALREVGFRHLRSAGHGGHRFYFAFNRRRWVQIDGKLAPPLPPPPPPRRRLGGRARRGIPGAAVRAATSGPGARSP